jgi:ParB family transcriptional regulator, chromosome partitioning protein
MNKRQALGKGLDALIPQLPGKAEAPRSGAGTLSARGEPLSCPIEEIVPGRHQPRKRFDEKGILELAQSIKEDGVLQPLLVRPREGKGAKFELVAGERRWRAAQKAGLKEVPIIVRKLDDSKALELSLVENLQREDLNPIEEAEGFRRLTDEFGYSQDQLAERVGKDRSTVANALRLLKLPAAIKEDLAEGKITAGHARAILSLPSSAEMNLLKNQIVKQQLSVRQAENIARRMLQAGAKPGKPSKAKADPNVRRLEEDLQRVLGTRVTIHYRPGRPGKIEIAYSSLDDLDRIIKSIKKG